MKFSGKNWLVNSFAPQPVWEISDSLLGVNQKDILAHNVIYLYLAYLHTVHNVRYDTKAALVPAYSYIKQYSTMFTYLLEHRQHITFRSKFHLFDQEKKCFNGLFISFPLK